jgi:hypothetical protein
MESRALEHRPEQHEQHRRKAERHELEDDDPSGQDSMKPD